MAIGGETFERYAGSQREVAAFFGVTPETVKLWRSKGMPGKASRYPLGEIARWLRETVWAPRKPMAVDPDDEPMAGESSPAQERYRAAKADLAELELAERRKHVCNTERLRRSLMAGIQVLRQTGERIQRVGGREVWEIHCEGLDEFERAMVEALGDDE